MAEKFRACEKPVDEIGVAMHAVSVVQRRMEKGGNNAQSEMLPERDQRGVRGPQWHL